MKKLLLITLLISVVGASHADTWVNGHTRSNGTFVPGHYRSDANKTKADNWSTRGNVNPHTGKAGTRAAF